MPWCGEFKKVVKLSFSAKLPSLKSCHIWHSSGLPQLYLLGWDLDWLTHHSCTMACTIIGLISLDTYLGECAAVLVLQCCLATSTPGKRVYLIYGMD